MIMPILVILILIMSILIMSILIISHLWCTRTGLKTLVMFTPPGRNLRETNRQQRSAQALTPAVAP
jgi:hypothetical protein